MGQQRRAACAASELQSYQHADQGKEEGGKGRGLGLLLRPGVGPADGEYPAAATAPVSGETRYEGGGGRWKEMMM
eukprot:750825-Hanusia_phi.AAC.1